MAGVEVPEKGVAVGYVFISYSRADSGYVVELVAYLREAAFEVWFDEEVPTGRRWDKTIQARIDGCAAFVLVMSPDSEGSHWVAEELNRAINKGKPIVPLLLEGEPHFGVARTQFADVTGGVLPSPVLVGHLRTLLAAAEQPTRSPVVAAEVGPSSGAQAATGPSGGFVVPAELPAMAAAFVGRAAELARLDELLASAAAGIVPISAVAGLAGVGKTALAVRWAYRMTDRFPDGQLYVDLRGFDAEEPRQPADVLAQFLVSLGVREVPVELSARAARYRSRLANRRVLVLLDNAANSAQVRPLLPGTASCCVLITSRDSLAGLVARDGVQRVDLDVLSAAEAGQLVTNLVGDRAAANPSTVTEVADRCGRLPLALRIAAERAVSRPELALADLVSELSDEQTRLDLLQGDESTTISGVFSWSYRQLEPAAALLFRRLGLHPGIDMGIHAAAALAGTDLTETGKMINALRQGYLVQPAAAGRIGLHDLLRSYAAQLTSSEDDEPSRAAAMTRLLDFYLVTAAQAMDLAFPSTRSLRPPVSSAAAVIPTLNSPEQATAWLSTERQNLVDIAVYAARHGWPRHAGQFAVVLFVYLMWHDDHISDTLVVHESALAAARELGDRAMEADALRDLGRVYGGKLGHWREAFDYHYQALTIMRRLGDRHGADTVGASFGSVCVSLGRHSEATTHLTRALALARQSGDGWAEAMHLNLLAIIATIQGRYDDALSTYRQAAAIFEEVGDHTTTAKIFVDIANVLSLRGQHDAAQRHAEQALAVLQGGPSRIDEGCAIRTTGVLLARLGRHEEAKHHHQLALDLHEEHDQASEWAADFDELGQTELALGHPEQAITHHRQALTVFRQRGMWDDQAAALNHLGAALHATGQDAEARRCHRQAIDMAKASGNRLEQAQGLHGAAKILAAQGDTAQAHRYLTDAVAILAELGLSSAHTTLE